PSGSRLAMCMAHPAASADRRSIERVDRRPRPRDPMIPVEHRSDDRSWSYRCLGLSCLGAGPVRIGTMIEIDVIPLELATFRLPDRDPAGRQGVVIGYAVRHPDGVFLFDTGFGSGNAELDATYRPVPRPIRQVLYDAGIDPRDVTAVANCHLHADHAGQNGALPGVPIHVQSAEWELAHTTDHTVLEWIDAPGADAYLLVDGDHEITPSIRIIATPGHTRGHQSIVVTTGAETIVLAG